MSFENTPRDVGGQIAIQVLKGDVTAKYLLSSRFEQNEIGITVLSPSLLHRARSAIFGDQLSLDHVPGPWFANGTIRKEDAEIADSAVHVPRPLGILLRGITGEVDGTEEAGLNRPQIIGGHSANAKASNYVDGGKFNGCRRREGANEATE